LPPAVIGRDERGPYLMVALERAAVVRAATGGP
jgi:hypothetical protein